MNLLFPFAPSMSEFEITISDQQSHLAFQTDRLREAIDRILAEEGVVSAEISLALVDDAAIRRINRDFLNHDYPTDVISFSLGLPCGLDSDHACEPDCTDSAASPDAAAVPADRHSGRHLEGELVVSTETAIREAPAHGWSPEDELLLYVVHGLLHLCGYDDLTDAARPVMRRRERQVLAYWQLTPTGLEA
jgi:probable rRNA maturation factor